MSQGDGWTYATRKLTSWYGATAIATTTLDSGDSVVIPAGRILTGIWGNKASWYLEGLEYNGSTWEQIYHPSEFLGANIPSIIGEYGSDSDKYIIALPSHIYCDGTSIRIRSTADSHSIKYWYSLEDT